ncbi:MAG: hypothetical protein ACRC6D_09925 [Aeromonas sp.]
MNLTKGIALWMTVIFIITGCTTTQSFYTGEDDLSPNEEFSLFNTIMLPVGALVVVGMALGASQGGTTNSSQGSTTNSSSSCNGSYCGNSVAWDYLPGSGQYRCRNTDNGEFVDDYNCASQYEEDNWH